MQVLMQESPTGVRNNRRIKIRINGLPQEVEEVDKVVEPEPDQELDGVIPLCK